MTDTTITDAYVFPQDEGTGVPSGNESFDSAAGFGLLAQSIGTTFVGHDLGFAQIDTTDGSEHARVNSGYAFIVDDASVTNSDRDGSPKAQSDGQESYDTELPTGSEMTYAVVLPTQTADLSLDTDVVNDVWLAVDPTTSKDPVYIRHGDGLSAPSDPSIKLGTVDAAAGGTTRPNDKQVLSGAAGGAVDLDGNALTDGSRGYVELGSSEDLRVGKDQYISDSDGTGRIAIGSGTTNILDANGDMLLRGPGGRVQLRDTIGNIIFDGLGGSWTQIRAYSGQPFQIEDEEGSYTAVQYDTDATSGLLNQPQSMHRIEGGFGPTGNMSGVGLEMWATGSDARLQTYDRGASSFVPMKFLASRYDFSGNAADLRLATGQGIEGGGGNDRISLGGSGTDLRDATGTIGFAAFDGSNRVIYDQSGTQQFVVNDSRVRIDNHNLRIATGRFIEDGGGDPRIEFNSNYTTVRDSQGNIGMRLQRNSYTRLYATNPSTPIQFYDGDGGFVAAEYIPSASAPGTLALSRADLDMSGNHIESVRYMHGQQIGASPSLSDYEWAMFQSNGSPEGDSGDVVIKATETGAEKSASIFDFSAGSVSSERFKRNIRSLDYDPYSVLSVEAISYDENGEVGHWFNADELYQWREDAVHTTTLSERFEGSDYAEKWGYEVGDEVPNQPKMRPIIAAHHEIIRDLRDRVAELESQVAA